MLLDFAKTELEIAGLFDEDSDYGGMIGTAVMEIMEVFSKQGHSGFSASMVTDIVNRLMRYEPLTPLTYGPEEWYDRSAESGRPMWQNKRKPSVFSVDHGVTHYDLDKES